MHYPLRRQHLLLLLACLLWAMNGNAQSFLQGTVFDKEKKMPVAGATITLHEQNNELILAYTLTDAGGKFRLKLPAGKENLQVSVAMMGYAKQNVPLTKPDEELEVWLAMQAIQIREITVKPERISRQRDTLIFDVLNFQDAQDRSIADVLRKMPGLNISPTGVISFNGLPINAFYIEGLNLLDGRYNIASENVPANAVSKIEILENHQPVKALEQTVFSDRAALNLKLKENAKARIIGKIEAGAGATPFLWDAGINLMRFAGKSQMIDLYKTNNIGKDLSYELVPHFGGAVVIIPGSITGGNINLVGIVAPSVPNINQRYTLFNNTQMVSVNHLWPLKKDYELRMNLHYLYDFQKQNMEQATEYFVDADSNIVIRERQHAEATQNRLGTEFTLTTNKTSHYLKNVLKAEGRWGPVTAETNSNGKIVKQFLKVPDYLFSNDLQIVKVIKKRTLNVSSLNRYTAKPQQLTIQPGLYETVFTHGAAYDELLQKSSLASFYSRTNASYSFASGWWTFGINAFFQAQIDQLTTSLSPVSNGILTPATDSFSNDIRWNSFKYGAEGTLTYKNKGLSATFSIPLSYEQLHVNNRIANAKTPYDKAFFNPSLYVKYEINSFWEVTARAGFNQRRGSIKDINSGYMLYDYRAISRNTALLPEFQQQSYLVRLSYRHPVSALFLSGGISYSPTISNILYDRNYTGVLSSRVPVEESNTTGNWTADVQFSKIVDALRTTFRIDVNYLRNKSQQIVQTYYNRYVNQSISCTPRIQTRLASWTNFQYTGNFSRISTKLVTQEERNYDPMFSMSHTLNYFLNPFKKLQIRLGAEYYRTYVSSISYPSLFFLDAGVTYVIRKVDLSLSAANLLNVDAYEYASYSAMSAFSSRYDLRPISVLLRCSFNF